MIVHAPCMPELMPAFCDLHCCEIQEVVMGDDSEPQAADAKHRHNVICQRGKSSTGSWRHVEPSRCTKV